MILAVTSSYLAQEVFLETWIQRALLGHISHWTNPVQQFPGSFLALYPGKILVKLNNFSHTKSSYRNYVLQIEDFASRLQTCTFSFWKLLATAGIIHTYAFFVTGLWSGFYTEFTFQVWSSCPISELLKNNVKLKLVSGRARTFSLVFLLCYLCEQAST